MQSSRLPVDFATGERPFVRALRAGPPCSNPCGTGWSLLSTATKPPLLALRPFGAGCGCEQVPQVSTGTELPPLPARSRQHVSERIGRPKHTSGRASVVPSDRYGGRRDGRARSERRARGGKVRGGRTGRRDETERPSGDLTNPARVRTFMGPAAMFSIVVRRASTRRRLSKGRRGDQKPDTP